MEEGARRPQNINPFPRLDAHEAQFDLWFNEISQRISTDEKSDFYYKKWVE